MSTTDFYLHKAINKVKKCRDVLWGCELNKECKQCVHNIELLTDIIKKLGNVATILTGKVKIKTENNIPKQEQEN